MHHRIGGRQFGLPSDQRRALLKGLVRSLLIYQTIRTTETRAKDVRAIAEKLITNARVDSLHARRQARRYLSDETLVHHLFTQIAPEFKGVSGGYTRAPSKSERVAAMRPPLSNWRWQLKKNSACRRFLKRQASRYARAETRRRVRRHGFPRLADAGPGRADGAVHAPCCD